MRSRIPIIVVNAKAGGDDKVVLLGFGARDYIAKSFAARELLEHISPDCVENSLSVHVSELCTAADGNYMGLLGGHRLPAMRCVKSFGSLNKIDKRNLLQANLCRLTRFRIMLGGVAVLVAAIMLNNCFDDLRFGYTSMANGMLPMLSFNMAAFGLALLAVPSLSAKAFFALPSGAALTVTVYLQWPTRSLPCSCKAMPGHSPRVCSRALRCSVFFNRLHQLRQARWKHENGDLALRESVTNISHDLHTPLTAMCGYLNLCSLAGARPRGAPARARQSREQRGQVFRRRTSTLR